MTASVFNGFFARKKAPAPPPKASELWEALDEPMPEAARVRGAGIGLLRRSPLARKILAFNLGVLLAIICTVLILVPRVFGSDSNDRQGLMKQVGLAALVLAPLGPEAPLDARLAQIVARTDAAVFVFDDKGQVRAASAGAGSFVTLARQMQAAPDAAMVLRTAQGATVLAARAPLDADHVVVMLAPHRDALTMSIVLWQLGLFIVAIFASLLFSLKLASPIANPLTEMTAAAKLWRDKNARKLATVRVRLPNLADRPDEIGELSTAIRGMVEALHDRVEANEQFASDMAHELKNPLASLRSAVGTMRVAKRPEQRDKLLEVIEHDARRLDRLVSDISHASRLDSDLVKEEEEPFDLAKMLRSLTDYHREQAGAKGIELYADLPREPVMISGLEARLAQVFVNLLANAMSFCGTGDTIRVWLRIRDNRALAVVEDTGPGFSEDALAKVFKRFYSERPESQFGQHSGLGLAIARQIVEAHGGVIWAENVRPPKADPDSDPLGARLVVGLPL